MRSVLIRLSASAFVQNDPNDHVPMALAHDKLCDCLNSLQIRVRGIQYVFPRSFSIKYELNNEDKLLHPENLLTLREAGFILNPTREMKSRRTLVIRNFNPNAATDFEYELTKNHSWVNLIEHQHIPTARLMKIMLPTQADALILQQEGITLECFDYPSNMISFEIPLKVPECLTC